MTDQITMPRHVPRRRVVECSCGARVDADYYEQHVKPAARAHAFWCNAPRYACACGADRGGGMDGGEDSPEASDD